ncbi:HNH endonuclease [Horticoccus sp. 23ND18S-11]|uniref:HNH endonuclease n=1 Tax=Horticoccus sp. 23ND18S-11 TaxID=3391832 RepID=UPI0039C990FE
MARIWTRDELIVAMNLYSRLTFGQLHARHPLIVATAAKMDRSPSSLAMKLCNLASFDPAVTGRGRVGLKGASRLDREVWSSFQADWETLGTESEERFTALLGTALAAEEEERWILREGPTEVETTARRRRGQDFFRRTVLVSYHHRCCITGTPIPTLLSASHIVAWSADRAQRLNPRNGLCLAKTQDAAFDRHLITLDEDLRVVLSKSIRDHFTSEAVRANFQPYEGRQIALPHRFTPDPTLLKRHRDLFWSSPSVRPSHG